MIVKLKMHTTGTIFGKIVSKNYQRYLYSKHVVWNQESDGVRHDACCLKRTSNAIISEIQILLKTYSQKLGHILIKTCYCCIYPEL